MKLLQPVLALFVVMLIGLIYSLQPEVPDYIGGFCKAKYYNGGMPIEQCVQKYKDSKI